jgi:2-alkyl-3-oxoalkanoate reductase
MAPLATPGFSHVTYRGSTSSLFRHTNEHQEELNMRVFLAGGTGAIGRRLVPQLVAHGHEVTATTRDPRKMELLTRLGATPVVVNGLDAAGIGAAVARADPEAVIHQMTSISGAPDLKHFDRWFAQTNRLRTEGTEHLLAAAKAAGVRRFIAQGFTGWTNARTGGPVKTEADQLDPEPPKAMRQTMAAIRFLEEVVPAAPMEGIVLRYGSLYGPGASELMVEVVRKRKMPVIGNGGGVWSWTHVDDATAATVAALERGARGVYNVVDDEPAPVALWLPYLAEVIGAKAPMHVPVWLVRLVVGDTGVEWMTHGRGASNTKAKRELEWRPTWSSWRDGFRHGLTDPAPAAVPRTTTAVAGT